MILPPKMPFGTMFQPIDFMDVWPLFSNRTSRKTLLLLLFFAVFKLCFEKELWTCVLIVKGKHCTKITKGERVTHWTNEGNHFQQPKPLTHKKAKNRSIEFGLVKSKKENLMRHSWIICITFCVYSWIICITFSILWPMKLVLTQRWYSWILWMGLYLIK